MACVGPELRWPLRVAPSRSAWVCRKPLFRFLLFPSGLFLCAELLCASVSAASESYRFAVVPQFEQRKLFGIWKSIIDEVKRRAGVDLELVATLSVPEFEQSLSKGEFDFVYTTPSHIYLEGPRQGYLPLCATACPCAASW